MSEEEESETRSTCSLGSSPCTPQDLLSPCPFASSSSSSSPAPSPSPLSSSSSSPAPSSRPCSLDLTSPVSLSDFGLISPVLGPRSECSGASSPECDMERGDRAEGAEGELHNTLNNNNHRPGNASSSRPRKTAGLEGRFSFLNLRRSPRTHDAAAKNVGRDLQSCLPTSNPAQPGILVNGL